MLILAVSAHPAVVNEMTSVCHVLFLSSLEKRQTCRKFFFFVWLCFFKLWIYTFLHNVAVRFFWKVRTKKMVWFVTFHNPSDSWDNLVPSSACCILLLLKEEQNSRVLELGSNTRYYLVAQSEVILTMIYNPKEKSQWWKTSLVLLSLHALVKLQLSFPSDWYQCWGCIDLPLIYVLTSSSFPFLMWAT